MVEAENILNDEAVQDVQLNENRLKGIPELKEVSELAERLDLYDVMILKKFYSSSGDSSVISRPYCFPLLFKEMSDVHKIKIGLEALRKRMKVLCDNGLLIKISNSNPSSYLPVPGKEMFVKAVVLKFALINGLTKIF